MCRNIKTLYNFEPPATADEVRAAALQFVRKVSGYRKPSKANDAAFAAAVEEIAVTTTQTMLATRRLIITVIPAPRRTSIHLGTTIWAALNPGHSESSTSSKKENPPSA